MKTGYKIFAVIIGLALSLSTMNAQPKALGLAFSFSGFGLSYEHNAESDNFLTVDLGIDTDDYMWSRSERFGGAVSLVWNMVFAERKSQYGNVVRFFAGPGVMAGYVTDLGDTAGTAFGMKGRIGMECRFQRSIVLSASLSPILGCHLTTKNDEIRMRLYKSGLLQTVIPEIGIKYAF